jgi:membrane associated rhomboid family serine protease
VVGNLFSGPVSSEFGWLARIFSFVTSVLALDRKCRQRRRRQMDAPKIF